MLFSARQALAMHVFPDAVSLTKFLTQLASGGAVRFRGFFSNARHSP
jgi:hypothetical protein